jgi:hypothetical protein
MSWLGGQLRLVHVVLAASLWSVAAAPLTKEMSPDIAMPILGRTVYSAKGDTVGRVTDVLVDAAGLPQAAVLDVGGFLGVGNRIIAVHWSTLHFHPTDKDHPITIDMPAEEIEAAPQYTDTTAPAQVVVPHVPPLSPLGVVAKPLSAATAPAAPPASSPKAAEPAPPAPAPAPAPTPAPANGGAASTNK